MRRLIMWNMVTLDGMFEGAGSWELDYHEHVWGEELERFSLEQAETADMLLFGRVTYEGMAAHWSSAEGEIADFMNRIPKLVFSRTMGEPEWSNTRLVKTDAVDEVTRLKREPGRDMYVFGSGELCTTLMEHDLFDEYRLGLNPIVLGNGNPLFKPASGRMRFTLLETRALSSGCVILRYARRPE